MSGRRFFALRPSKRLSSYHWSQLHNGFSKLGALGRPIAERGTEAVHGDISRPTLSNSHLARRPNGGIDVRGLLVVPRWLEPRRSIKFSRVKPPGYAVRQLTIELPTHSSQI